MRHELWVLFLLVKEGTVKGIVHCQADAASRVTLPRAVCPQRRLDSIAVRSASYHHLLSWSLLPASIEVFSSQEVHAKGFTLGRIAGGRKIVERRITA